HLALALSGAVVAVDNAVGEDALVVHAAGPSGPLAVPQLLVVLAEEALELADVADLRSARVRPEAPLRVGDHRHDLAADQVLGTEDVDGVPDGLAHLADA